MNLTTTFEPASDGWFHIAPHGTFPHPTGAQQVIDAEACETMARTFAEEARQPNFPGLLVDFDHFSHDPARPSAAAGWVSALEARADGLYAQVRWSDLGQAAVTGGRYRLVSPVWNRADCDSWTAPAGPAGQEAAHLRPRRLARVALTNDPNLPGLAPLTNRGAEPVPQADAKTLRNRLLEVLPLAASATDDEIVTAVREHREAQADAELEAFADVITNRVAVRAQLLANREGTLEVLRALRRPETFTPLHDPRARRPNLQLLSPLGATETDPGAARRIANRARELQSQLKIGHHAAFRLAEGEDAA
jgi:phage I-like protein